MNTIKRGDVYFCQGSPDAVGSEERKTRPVVVVQNDAGNASAPTVIVANMTTNTTRRLYPMQFDIPLPGRPVSSVLCEQIRTVDKCRLLEKVYSLNDDELRKLDECLAVSFGMNPHQDAQEGPQEPPNDPDDIFRRLTKTGLSVAVCPSCAGPGEHNRHRREERLSDPKRRRRNWRDRRRNQRHEGGLEGVAV
jgi:mRNA interferase MazF